MNEPFKWIASVMSIIQELDSTTLSNYEPSGILSLWYEQWVRNRAYVEERVRQKACEKFEKFVEAYLLADGCYRGQWSYMSHYNRERSMSPLYREFM